MNVRQKSIPLFFYAGLGLGKTIKVAIGAALTVRSKVWPYRKVFHDARSTARHVPADA